MTCRGDERQRRRSWRGSRKSTICATRASTPTRSLRPHAHPRRVPRALGRPRGSAPTPTRSPASPAGMCSRRDQGKLVFATLRDGTGEVQLFVSKAELGDDAFAGVPTTSTGATGSAPRHGHAHQEGRAVGQGHPSFSCSRSRCGRCPTSGTVCPTSTRASASATSISSPTTRPAACSPFAARPCSPCVRSSLDLGYLEVETPVLQPIVGRRHRPAVHHASQRARHRALSPHRAGAVSQAPHRCRSREGVRDRPGVPQRGLVDAAQPRVHDARALRGLRRLPHDAARTEDLIAGAAQAAARHHEGGVGRAADRPHAAVPPRADDRARDASTAGVDMHPSMPVEEAAGDLRPTSRSRGSRVGERQAAARGLREDHRARDRRAHLRHGLSARGLAARPGPPPRPRPHRALRAHRGRS